ncbi:MAG: endonuclease/exonuclease/phosphatase family protein [Planctomycetales bacterium]|nr:endonuclease/exonuclease/phosphatase family protein [Planctomycetales bacterium]
MRRDLILPLAFMALLLIMAEPMHAQSVDSRIRVATFNVSLNRSGAGDLEKELAADSQQASRIAAVIRHIRPDILLLNELDFSAQTNNAKLFHDNYLANPQTDLLGGSAIHFKYLYSGPVNTGVSSQMDLNANGNTDDPEDAFGFGRFPGQYGMAAYSCFPILEKDVRTFQNFLWAQLPRPLRPYLPDGTTYYSDQVWPKLRLSSKSFWDIPIVSPLGKIHVLASHPTPPAFDGPEDRNGCRNHDEIMLIKHYIDNEHTLIDDAGIHGGLPNSEPFVVLGDLNSDPVDGGSRPEAISLLLNHNRVCQVSPPISQGAKAASSSQGGMNRQHKGDPQFDTGDFSDNSVGNLRVDYVLPSNDFRVVESGVFWPSSDELPLQFRQAFKDCINASDHRLVWADIQLPK